MTVVARQCSCGRLLFAILITAPWSFTLSHSVAPATTPARAITRAIAFGRTGPFVMAREGPPFTAFHRVWPKVVDGAPSRTMTGGRSQRRTPNAIALELSPHQWITH